MIIKFKTKKLKKSFESEKALKSKYGSKGARKIGDRLTELKAAQSLIDLGPPKSLPARCHELTEGKRGKEHQLSVDLDHPYRLIFVPDHMPIPLCPDNSLDWEKITVIKIIGVEDTHE